ncbi:hypothetical protein LTR17_027373 [Elasticomyces elasticus]|nr:hypothetical protein LTR17_027373 [Elasticomyces elasticus]
MRLINTQTLQLEEFFDSKVPKYTILSHRWESDEVSHKSYVKGRFETTQDGYKKIVGCCDLARRRAHDYVWIDNKRSSAELSEAINSMYKWYQHAQECYIYMSDVPPPADDPKWRTRFAQSAWFTRGWTLQELLAPRTRLFCAQDWTILGLVVEGTSRCSTYELGGHRETTREEDQAYCLLGIFGINMPLLYGEGTRAFWRLQQEIMKRTNDETIFVFVRPGEPRGDLVYATPELNRRPLAMLATSPTQFSPCHNVQRAQMHQRPPYQLTNQGLEIRLGQAYVESPTSG